MARSQKSDAEKTSIVQGLKNSRADAVVGNVEGDFIFEKKYEVSKPIILLAVVILAGLIAFSWWFYNRPTFVFEPAREGETLVVLTSFSGGSKDAEFDPLRILREPIQSRLERLGMQKDEEIRLEEWVQPVSSARQARELGQKYNATLVIWGEFDDVIGVRTYVEIMKHVPQPYAQQSSDLLPVATPETSMEQGTEIGRIPIRCLIDDLPHQGDYLTTLSVGIMQLTKHDFSGALQLFSQSLEAASDTANGQCAISPQFAYYWRGLSYGLQENYPQALTDFDQALLIQPDLLFALVQRGNVNISLGNPAASLRDYQAALGLLYPEDEHGRAALVGNIGLSYELLGQFDQAESHYREALNVDEAKQEPEALALDWLHLGNLALRRNEKDLAGEYLNRSLDYYEEAENQAGQATVLGNLALIAYQDKDYAKALQLFNYALSKSEGASDKNGQARQLVRISQVYLAQQDMEAAQKYLEQALALSQQTGSLYGQAMAHIGLGRTANQRNDLANARSHLQQALNLLHSMNSPDAKIVQDVLDQMK